MTTSSHPVERILALIEGELEDATLEAAAELAARRGLPLVGLLVEDADLLATAGLPFAREIGLASGSPRPLSADAIEARMRTRNDRFQRVLLDLARRHGIQAELDVSRGRRAQAVLGRLRPEDVLVLRRTSWVQRPGGLQESLLVDARCAILLVGNSTAPRARSGHPMVLLDGSAGCVRGLAKAIALAHQEHRGLTLLVAPGRQTVPVYRQALTTLAEHGIEGQSIELPRLDPTTVLRSVQREQPQLLFVSRDSPVLTGAEGHRLAEREDVPLVIVP